MVEEKIVEVVRSPTKGFGFSIVGGSNTHLPPMICSLLDDSPAASSGQINVGDVIKRVNGICTKKLISREIKEIVDSSDEKLVLTLVEDSGAKKSAKPYLSNGPVAHTKTFGRLTRVSTVSYNFKSTNSKTEAEIVSSKQSSDRKPSNTSEKEGLSPKYQRTVGSPDYDRLGADGKFAKSGSLDRLRDSFTFDSDSGLVEDNGSSTSEPDTTSKYDQSDTKHINKELDLPYSDEPFNRLSIPLFGSAPRLHSTSSTRIDMKQGSQYNNVHQFQKHSREVPLFHRRSASHDEETLNFIRRQQCFPNAEYRVQFNSADNQNALDINRGIRTSQAVRFHGNSGQKWVGVGGPIPNGVNVHPTDSHAEVTSSSSPQELRNALIRHQFALRSQKHGGFSHRRFNSHDELQAQQDYSFRPIRQNGVIPNPRPVQLEKNFPGKIVIDDDEDDLQQSGYGIGFRRSNSLGKADTLKYNRNQDFIYSDTVHRSQYPSYDDSSRGMQLSRLSPALQQRLRDATSSMGVTSSIGKTSITSSKGPAYYDNFSQQSVSYRTNDASQNEEYFKVSPNSSRNIDFVDYGSGSLRDTEDGVVQSRYEYGKSLAVPTQQYPEEYFTSASTENLEEYDSRIGSRNSVGLQVSETAAHTEMTSRSGIPDELKTINATDLATRLFTLDGFASDEVAPLLGKNTDFSQQVCNEYMKFFNFEGLSIDDALRVLLQKFPVTGETQERERILLQFSKRYHECNGELYGSEDSVHTLTCALMLLNTDLHGPNIGTKMTANDFINNLHGLCDGQDFSRELLKTLYQSIKSKEIQYAASDVQKELKPSPKTRKPSSNGNPFIELKAHDDAVVMRKGMVLRKCLTETDFRRLPAMKRSWKPYFCILKGLVLFLQKPEKGQGEYSIGIHHSLAGFATEYKKRQFVFKLITADWRVFMFEVKSKSDAQEWVDCINISASALSSPPLPAPCSSSKQFTRPVMPVSVTKLSLEEQCKRHSERAESIEKDMREHREIQPDEGSKDFKEWESKMEYLEYEYKRFSAYAKVLCVPRLKDKISLLMSTQGKPPPSSMEEAPSNKPLRSCSMNDIGKAQNTSPTTRRRMRQSYLQAIHH